MINEKVKVIIEMLITSTKCGNLEWIQKGNPDKKDYHREFTATGEDGTKYEAEVKYLMSADGNWKLEGSPSLWIKSDKLPNGSFYVYGSEYDTKGLRQVLIDKYCQDMKPSEKVVEDALDSISKGISIVEYRDSKLNKILGVFGLNNK